MIRLTRSHRRLAALASTALAAGTLTVLPAVAGFSAASAAVTDLGYDCVISGGPSPVHKASTLDITVTSPALAEPGEPFTANVAINLDMGSQAMGPVTSLPGSVDVALTVGSEPTTVNIPINPPGTPGALVFAGSADVQLAAPDAAAADTSITIGDLTGKFTAQPVNMPTTIPCTANMAAQEVGTVDVGLPVFDYDCVISGGPSPVHKASTLEIDVDAAPTTTSDESKGGVADVSIKLDMGSQAMGPVTSLEGSVDVELTVGNKATTVSVPINPPGTPANLEFVGSKRVDLDAPVALGNANISVGNVTGKFTAKPVNQATTIPCAAAAVEKVGSTEIVAAPAGVKYDCSYEAWSFPAYVSTAATLPASVNEDTAFNPAVNSSLIWGRYWADSARNISMSFQNGTSALATSTSGKAGTASLAFTSMAVPPSGAMTWTAAGTYGAVDTANPGTATLSYGNFTLKAKVKNNFTMGQFMDAQIACVLRPGQNTTLGSVTINDVAEPVATKVPVTGKVKITGAAKVGKKLTAVPGKAAGATIKYQWMSNGKAIKKATAKTLKLTKPYKGKKITVKVTYSKTGFVSVTQISKAVKVKK
jgi:hypothetical protein